VLPSWLEVARTKEIILTVSCSSMQQPIIGDRYKGTCDRLSYCIIERHIGVTLVANMTAKMKRAPEFTFQPILLELLVQLTDQWKKFLSK
jgi:hypothetical protein